MVQINERALAELAEKSSTAEDFFEYAAKRTRNIRGGVSRLVQINEQMRNEGYHPLPQDMLSLFKELDRMGIGVLNDGKFKWGIPIREVGRMATRKPANPAQTQEQSSRSEVLHMVPVPSSASALKKELTMVFASGNEATVIFNPTLSREEIQILLNKVLRACNK